MTARREQLEVGDPLTDHQKAEVDSIMDTIGSALAEMSDQDVLASILGSVMMTCALRFRQPERFLDDARAMVDTAIAERRGETGVEGPDADDAAAVDRIGHKVALVLAECPNTNVLLDVVSAMVSFAALKSGEAEDFVGAVVACVMRVLAGHPPREAEDD